MIEDSSTEPIMYSIKKTLNFNKNKIKNKY